MPTVISPVFRSPTRPRSASSPVTIDTWGLRDTTAATSAGVASHSRLTELPSVSLPGPVSVARTRAATRSATARIVVSLSGSSETGISTAAISARTAPSARNAERAGRALANSKSYRGATAATESGPSRHEWRMAKHSASSRVLNTSGARRCGPGASAPTRRYRR